MHRRADVRTRQPRPTVSYGRSCAEAHGSIDCGATARPTSSARPASTVIAPTPETAPRANGLASTARATGTRGRGKVAVPEARPRRDDEDQARLEEVRGEQEPREEGDVSLRSARVRGDRCGRARRGSRRRRPAARGTPRAPARFPRLVEQHAEIVEQRAALVRARRRRFGGALEPFDRLRRLAALLVHAAERAAASKRCRGDRTAVCSDAIASSSMPISR